MVAMERQVSNNLASVPSIPQGSLDSFAEGAGRDDSASLPEDIARITQQHHMLRSVVARESALGTVVFQGWSLAQLATDEGLRILQRSAKAGEYDAVAMNHGIRRLRLDGYAGEVIWSYPGNALTITENDAVTRLLEQCAPSISAEVLGAIDPSVKFPDSDSLANPGGLWRYRSFYDRAGAENVAMRRACPITAEVINSLRPNLTLGFAFVSILEPNTTIAPHRGSTSLRHRYHLALKVPPDGISRIRIGRRWKSWTEGKAFGFNDSIVHEVEHLSRGRRIVLIVDVWPTHIPKIIVNGLKKYPELMRLATLSGQDSAFAIND